MNWKIGQKLVSLNGNWHVGFGPKKGEIVTFDGQVNNDGDISIYEYNTAWYVSEYFRPLLGDSARTELISSFVEVTETSDCPINVPQTETICS